MKFERDRCARFGLSGRAQHASIGTAHERIAALQDALVAKRCEQLGLGIERGATTTGALGKAAPEAGVGTVKTFAGTRDAQAHQFRAQTGIDACQGGTTAGCDLTQRILEMTPGTLDSIAAAL